ncbi:MAG: DUF2589 domain-containing protein [Roseburia sp.]|nr:DUF2589 domain-containing protein [Roseburia sp.]MCM1280063.1 DUF2589 domain-containing protein [Robinsoniella sp.]
MAIAEQFAGLEMDKLIGAPLTAAADASILLANSTADFINRVGFDKNNNARTVRFMYQQRSVNEDGTSNLDEMKVDVPMLAIVPIPNLQVDEVNVLFDMEVKQSEKQDTSMDVGATVTGSLGFGWVKVSVSGSVSAHSSHTRSSDNSAKYHVDVRATNHGIPEGLARVLDMMAANISPSLVNSTIKDGNGQNLAEDSRLKAERLKELRQEISQIEKRLSAAKDGLDNDIQQLKKIASTQQNIYQSNMLRLINSSKKDESGEKKQEEQTEIVYGQAMDEVNQSWDMLKSQAADFIRMLADNPGKEDKGILELFALKALKEGEVVSYGEGESCYEALKSSQKNAIASQIRFSQIETELSAKKREYNDAIAGKSETGAVAQNRDSQ